MPGGSADTTGLYLSVNEKDVRKLGVNKPPVAAGRASGILCIQLFRVNQKNLYCYTE